MLVRNAWYVADWSEAFGQSLSPVRILGDAIVIYRKADGGAVALEDACPHRKLPLSRGRLKGDVIECGYHGLTFDCSGKCVRAPTQESMIPKGAEVRSYPVIDRWNLLWIWMGDPDRANADEIVNIENFDNPAWGKTAGGALEIACNYLYVMDNLLDPSHVAWVHQSSFAGAGTENEPLKMDRLEDGIVVWRWTYDRPPPPYYAGLLKFEGNCDRKQHYECRLPSIAINKSIFTPCGTGGPDKELPDQAFVNISYNFMTPVDGDNTRYFWFQHRNTEPDNEEISRYMFDGAKMAFEEDRDVLTLVHNGMTHRKTPNIDLRLDTGAVQFRILLEKRMLAEQEQAGAGS